MKRRTKKATTIYVTELDYNRLNGLIDRTRERNGIDREYLNKHIKKDEVSEVVNTATVGPMHQIHALLEFDDAARAVLIEEPSRVAKSSAAPGMTSATRAAGSDLSRSLGVRRMMTCRASSGAVQAMRKP